MPWWQPEEEWKGEDAYIIGGGPSLHAFDFERLRGKNVIGINGAITLGHEIAPITIFADPEWYRKVGKDLGEQYGGRLVGCSSRFVSKPPPEKHLLLMRRAKTASYSKTELGFAGNCGSLAINLALILGAKRVFLLGFDMKLSEKGKANWHDVRVEPDNAKVYPRFIRGFQRIHPTLARVFPGREVWNVTDDSDLPCFPKVSVDEHFNGGLQ